jgi:WD repeat-containing protein 7
MSHQSPSHFTVPLTFPAASSLRIDEKGRCETTRILERSLTKSFPTILKYWTTTPKDVQDVETHALVLGCRDGTLYVFHRLSTPSPDAIGLVPELLGNNKLPKPRNLPRISKIPSSNSLAVSASALSVLSPTFNVTAKLRVVSGVTTEQVEAPKNYVDFEDEPDKLKDILKGRNPRERYDNSSDRAPKSPPSSIIEPAPKPKNLAPKSLLSVENSRSPTPPFSAPASPREGDSHSPPGFSYHWELLYHVIPYRSGFEHSVKSVQFLDDGRFLAVLQKSGYVGLSSKFGFLTPVTVIYTFSCLKMALV